MLFRFILNKQNGHATDNINLFFPYTSTLLLQRTMSFDSSRHLIYECRVINKCTIVSKWDFFNKLLELAVNFLTSKRIPLQLMGVLTVFRLFVHGNHEQWEICILAIKFSSRYLTCVYTQLNVLDSNTINSCLSH